MLDNGLNIRTWRALEGLSQIEAARRLNTTNTTISKWESDSHPILSSRKILEIFYRSGGIITPNSILGITQEEIHRVRNGGVNASQVFE